MAGYTPGKQVNIDNYIKINTNENPYPPSPKVKKVLSNITDKQLIRYPNPTGDKLRAEIANVLNVNSNNVILGNGSDDILTIALRSFVDKNRKVASVYPTYSLYSVLANIQGAECSEVNLNEDFSLPAEIANDISEANLFLLPRPNAPTGTTFPKEKIIELCENFNGIVLIDEAYADFAEDNCIDLINRFDNLIVSRTFSKSYSLAGARIGFAIANENLINGMMKVKDSYNVNVITQEIATAAMNDQEYLNKTVTKICETRNWLVAQLKELNFTVLESHTNFLFVIPPNSNGEEYFNYLFENNILTRHFKGGVTDKFVRISVGTDKEMQTVIDVTKQYLQQ